MGPGIKKTRLLEAGRCIILFLFYKLVPPPCSAGIIMTITIIITAIFVMTLFNLLLNIEGCYYTNIPELKIKNKELFIFFLLLYKNTLLKTLILTFLFNSIFSNRFRLLLIFSTRYFPYSACLGSYCRYNH